MVNRLSTPKRVQIVRALVEGMGIRATSRMVGVAQNTVLKLLRDLGTACEAFSDQAIHGVEATAIQCDEIWAFCKAKEKNVPEEHKGEWGWGDVWTWTAIEAETKLMLSWLVGRRDGYHAVVFLRDVASRVKGRPQITTDGFNAYRWAVHSAFQGDVDYAVLQKLYGATEIEPGRYSPPVCTGCRSKVVSGDPDPEKINTSYVERSNLTMRMAMRRFTRLTNGHSKRVENLAHAVALHFTHYNFVRKHQTLGTTPAVAAGLQAKPMRIEDLIGLLG